MRKHAASHVDHSLTEDQLRYLLDRFADRQSFFIETITLPRELGTVPCGLYGPVMGDPSIGEDEITYAPRGSRAWNSRLIELPTRQQHEVTVIAGPHEEPCWHCDGSGGIGSWKARIPCWTCDHGKVKHACILYTAFGGPLAPQEPGDPGCKDPEASAAFWRDHALSK
jgi:hypothetical protein